MTERVERQGREGCVETRDKTVIVVTGGIGSHINTLVSRELLVQASHVRE